MDLRALVTDLMALSIKTKSAALKRLVEQQVHNIAHGRVRPDPPLSQSLDEVADPWYGLGTHPDIIEIMWRLDDSLNDADGSSVKSEMKSSSTPLAH